MSDMEEFEREFDAHLASLMTSWQELGIDPDAFLTCALCHELTVDPDNHYEARAHCQNTTYVVKTFSGIEHARIVPGKGGLAVANKEAMAIRGRLFGISTEGEEIRLAFYDRE